VVKTSSETLSLDEYRALSRRDFVGFAQRCFRELNPRTRFAMGWRIEVIAAKLAAVREGKIRRLVINLPPRHLKSLLASIAFPAWCLGHEPSAQILCVSYAQDLADKLSRDCRHIVAGGWYRQLFPTRLSPQRAAMPEFDTTEQGCCLATSVGGVLTGRGADLIIIDDPLKPDEALSQAQRQAYLRRLCASATRRSLTAALAATGNRRRAEHLSKLSTLSRLDKGGYPMRYVSATDAKQRLAALIDAAQREPVVIRRQNREVAVLLSSQEYDRLRALNTDEFQHFCDRISERADARGLTEEKLAKILADES